MATSETTTDPSPSFSSGVHIMEPPYPDVAVDQYGGELTFRHRAGGNDVRVSLTMMDATYLRGLAKACEELADELDRQAVSA